MVQKAALTHVITETSSRSPVHIFFYKNLLLMFRECSHQAIVRGTIYTTKQEPLLLQRFSKGFQIRNIRRSNKTSLEPGTISKTIFHELSGAYSCSIIETPLLIIFLKKHFPNTITDHHLHFCTDMKQCWYC